MECPREWIKPKFDRRHVASAARVAVEAQLDEHTVSLDCPACGCTGLLGGVLVDEEPGDHDDDEPWMQWVTQTFDAVAFHCVACKLHLEGEQELDAGTIASQFSKDNLRDIREEEEYAND